MTKAQTLTTRRFTITQAREIATAYRKVLSEAVLLRYMIILLPQAAQFANPRIAQLTKTAESAASKFTALTGDALPTPAQFYSGPRIVVLSPFDLFGGPVNGAGIVTVYPPYPG